MQMSDDFKNDDIIDFGTEGDDNVTDFGTYKRNFEREKKRRERRMKKVRKRLITIGVIVLIIALIIGFKDQLSVSNLRLTFSNIGAVIRGEDIDTIDFTYDTKNQYEMYKGCLVVGSSEGIRLQRSAGGESTVISRVFSDVQLDANSRYVLAYDCQGQNFIVISGTEVVKSENVSGTIQGARLSRGGGYSVITKVTGYRSVINVYGSDNSDIYRYYVAKNWVVDAHVSPNNRRMATIYVDTEGDSLLGGVGFFDFSKEEAVSRYTIEGEIPIALEYKDNNLISVLHSGGFLFFRADGKKVGEYLFDGDMPYFADLTQPGFACAVVGSGVSGDYGKLVIVNNSGKLRGSYELQSQVKKILASNSNVFLYTEDNKLLIFDLYGKLKKTADLDTNTKDLIMDEANNIYSIGIGRAEKVDY